MTKATISDGDAAMDGNQTDAPEPEEFDPETPTETQSDDGDEPEDDQAGDDEDGDDEFEIGGQKLVVPKSVKAALDDAKKNMEADYTRKTMDLGEQRRAVQAERQKAERELTAAREAGQEYLTAKATLAGVESQIAKYDNYTPEDWANARAQNPDAYQYHRDNHDHLRIQRDKAKRDLDGMSAQQQQQAEQKFGERYSSVLADVEKSIPDFGTVDRQLQEYVSAEFGISPNDLQPLFESDAGAKAASAIIKLAHRAYVADRDRKSLTDRLAKITKNKAAQATAPAVSATGTKPPARLDDRVTTAEWIERRNKQLQKKAG